jgi:hypothetical protein
VRDRSSDRNRSDVEPIEVIFRKLAQQRQAVPRSTEQGERYQGAHQMVPSRGTPSAAVEPPVMLNITTDPDHRRTVALLRSKRIRWVGVILFVSALAAALGIAVGLTKG